jgi:transcription antitermination factor NusA-like protein
LKSDILCSACQGKLDSGLISKEKIDVARYIYNLSEKMKSIRDVHILNIINSDVLVIVTGRGDAPKLVGRSGSVVKKIAQRFKKPIRILEEASNLKDFIEELIFPTPINGINTLYRNNEEIIRIRVPAIQKSHILIKPENFSEIISSFYNKKAELIFEI